MRLGRTILGFALAVLLMMAPACDDDDSKTTPEKETKTETKADLGPAYGDALLEGEIADAFNLLPAVSSDNASFEIMDLVYNGLIKVDENLDLVGDLAESWEISPEGTTITFHLRKGVKWHDGYPFTANDALFTYKVMIDPKTVTAYADDFKQVEKAEVLDKFTFRVTYARAFAPALLSWGFKIMPAHLLEGRDINNSDLARKPIGTGPYIFDSWEPKQRIILKANPDYFEGRPYIAESITRYIPDTATMFLELKSGGIDRMTLTPVQYARQTDTPEFKKNFNKYKYLAFRYTYLGFNLLDPKFRDKRIRQAIAHAVDKQEIVNGVLLGLGKVANGPYKPGSFAHNPEVKNYAFDPVTALRLLNDAGWADTDNDGILDKDGEPFAFTIMTNQGNKEREKTATLIQHRLREIGIIVNIRIVEWASFLKEFIDKKNFEAIVMGWTIPIDPDLFDVWHSSKTREGELNFISFQSSEVDRLIDEARYTFDREKRKKAYWRIQEILMEEVPYVFLYNAEALPCVSSRVHGIKPAPAGISYNFTKWYVPKSYQKYQVTP